MTMFGSCLRGFQLTVSSFMKKRRLKLTRSSLPTAAPPRAGASLLSAAATLWAIYPPDRWAVLWIADLAGLLGACAALASLLAYHTFLARRDRWYWLALAWLGFVLAVLAKETYLVLPLVLPVIEGLHGEQFSLRKVLQRGAPFVITALVLAIPIAASYAMRPSDGVAFDLVAWRLPGNLARWHR